MLSFTLSGKHLSYAYTHLTHKTITGNINFMHLYYELIQVLLLITILCLFQDFRRSYRTYAYATEFNLFEGTHRYHRDYRTCTGIAELILILKYL